MITLEVTAVNDQPATRRIAAQFDESGGNIGRGDGNTLVLPDPEKVISRTHATISFRAGAYIIEDRGTAVPILVNGRPLGNGRDATIRAGDVIQLGAYAMRVNAMPAANASVDAGKTQPIFDDPFAQPQALSTPSGHSLPGSGGGIPDDFDPFGSAPGPGHGKIPDELDLSLGSDNPAQDGNTNDFDFIGSGAGATDIAKLDAQTRPQPPIPTEAIPPSSMFVSWDAKGASRDGEIRTVVIPAADASRGNAPPTKPRQAAPAQPPRPQARPASDSAPVQSPLPARSQSSRATDSPAAGSDALLRAFLEGAGVPDLKMSGQLSPQLMQVFGQLLREATQGTLDLLVARSMVKREMRAQVTMIAARENNPLKFSPNVEAALSHLLNPQARGFMSPLRAMRDAYDDLRAHQFAVMTGMEAAFTAVLGRFRPAELELRLAAKSLVDSMLPMNRKAKLWNLFEERYSEIARELEDDFHSLFGKEFLRAYEERLDKLERESAGQRKS